MQVKSFKCEKNFFGMYRKRGLKLQKMNDPVAKMLNDGWKIFTQTWPAGDVRCCFCGFNQTGFVVRTESTS